MIAFSSRTGNVRHVIQQLGLPHHEITDASVFDEAFLLFTYTDKLGEVPPLVDSFMKRNHTLCKGIFVSGQTNFGRHLFGAAGDKLSAMYGIPVLHKIDLRGTNADYELLKKHYEVLWDENLPNVKQRLTQ